VSFHSKLAVLLSVVALVSSAQCLESCTIFGDCVNGSPAHASEDAPPCHHHHKTPANQNSPLPCHDFVLSGTGASLLAQIVLADPLIATPPVSASAAAPFVAIAEDPGRNRSPRRSFRP
jgi:hypothetical protein